MREQKLVEKEKVRAHDWIADLKLWFELEKQNFQDKFFQLEENLKKTPESKPADPTNTTAHVPPPPDGLGERSTEADHGTHTTATTPATPSPLTDSLREASDSSSTATGTSSSGGIVTDATGSDILVKSITELIMAQVQVVTKVASVQSLPSHH